MTVICLVRHGETDWNNQRKIQGRKDIPLNEMGSLQAKDCQNYLSKFDWNVIVTSPLQRAKQTAEIINEELQLPIVVMEEFIERDYGEIEGLTIEERLKYFPNSECPSQEKFEVVRERVMSGINRLHELYKNQNIIVVAHGGVIKVLLNSLFNEEVISRKNGLFNGGMSHIIYDDGWYVKDYNQVSHLSTLNYHKG